MSALSGSIVLIRSDTVTNADQRIPSLRLGMTLKKIGWSGWQAQKADAKIKELEERLKKSHQG